MKQDIPSQFTIGIFSIHYKPITLTLHRNFTTAHSTSVTRTNFMIKVSDNEKKLSGYGECGLPPKKPGCYLSDIDDCFCFMAELQKLACSPDFSNQWNHQWDKNLGQKYFMRIRQCKEEEKKVMSQVGRILSVLQTLEQEHFRAPKCAFQFAIFDWLARYLNLTVVQLIFGQIDKSIKRQNYSFYTVSYEQEISKMLQNTESGLKHTEFIKFKFNNDIEKLVQLLEQVCEMQKCGKIIVDANTSWSPQDFNSFINLSAKSPQIMEKIMYIQQPFDMEVNHIEEWEKIKQKNPINILADESCRNQNDFQKLRKVSHAVNIKTQKTGGLCNSIKAIQKAKEFGFEVILGSMVSTNLGCTQTFQMHPLVQYFDIDGCLLVKQPSPIGGFTWGQRGLVSEFQSDLGLRVDVSYLFD